MRLTTALCAGVALAVAVPAAGHSVKAGIDLWQQGKPAAAVAVWRPLAEKGDADAAFNLGQAYRLGKGVPINLGFAQKWFEVAARRGHVDAATSLGVLMFDNGNQTGAMRWLRQAADAGEPRALLIYGIALFNGDHVKADPVLAYAYVSRAAATGLAPAKATLADMDAMMPLDQRQRGVAIAQAAVGKGKAAAPSVASVKAAAPAKPVVIAKPAVALPAFKPAAVSAVTSGGWRIQLGAFAKKSSAETLFRSLAPSLGGHQAYYIAAGAVTRLQVGPFASKAEASAACGRVKQACFAVAVK